MRPRWTTRHAYVGRSVRVVFEDPFAVVDAPPPPGVPIGTWCRIVAVASRGGVAARYRVDRVGVEHEVDANRVAELGPKIGGEG